MRIRLRTRIGLALAGAAILIGAGGLWMRFGTFSMRPVIDGAIYRSSQPDASDLRKMIRRYGIKSVVNLRGAHPESEWYRDEVAATASLGLERRDFPFRSDPSDWPQTYRTRELVQYLESAPRPLLLHCQAGADRSGWAAAIVRALAGEPLNEVRRALSLPRGHACSEGCQFDRFFDQYTDWLADEGRTHDAAGFREWVFEHYGPGPFAANVELLSGPDRTRFAPGELVQYRVRVSNLSSRAWAFSNESTQGIRFGARILGPLESFPERPAETLRTPYTPAVDLLRIAPAGVVVEIDEPWETDVELRLPEEAGNYLLQFDMVDEYVHWFSDLGGAGLILELQIEG